MVSQVLFGSFKNQTFLWRTILLSTHIFNQMEIMSKTRFVCREVFGGLFVVLCLVLLGLTPSTVYHVIVKLFREVTSSLLAPFFVPPPAAYSVWQADFPSEKAWRRKKWVQKKNRRDIPPDLDKILFINQRYAALCRAEERMREAALRVPTIGPKRDFEIARHARLSSVYLSIKEEVASLMNDLRVSVAPGSRFTEHASFASSISWYKAFTGSSISSDSSGQFVGEIGRIASYLTMLNYCHSYTHFLAIVTNFVLSQFPTESAEAIQLVIDSIADLPTVLEDQSSFGDFKFTSIADIWNSAKHCKTVDKLKKLLALLVFCGFVKSGKTKIGIFDFSDFYDQSSISKLRSADMVTYIIDVGSNLLDSVSYVWSTGDWRSLFSGITTSQKFYLEYSEVANEIALLRIGNLSVMTSTVMELHTRIQQLLKDVTKMAVSASPQENLLYIRYARELKSFLSDVDDYSSRMPIVPTPFSVVLTGSPGVGKSNLYNHVIVAVSNANGFPATSGDICVTNPSSKFDNEYYWHTVQIFDDIAQTVSIKREGLVSDLFIRIINNVPSHALKSESKEKGKVLYCAKLIIGTTNVPDLDARSEVVEPAAVLRRWNYFIDMKLKPQYCIDGGIALDPKKIGNATDLWSLTVSKYKVTNTNQSSGVGEGLKIVSRDDAGPLERVGLERVLHFLVKQSREHYTEQNALVKKVMASYSAGVCSHSLPMGVCSCCHTISIPTPVPSPPTVIGSPDSHFGGEDQAGFNDYKKKVHAYMDGFPVKALCFMIWCRTYLVTPLIMLSTYFSSFCAFLIVGHCSSPWRNAYHAYLYYAPQYLLSGLLSLLAIASGYYILVGAACAISVAFRQWWRRQNLLIKKLVEAIADVPPEWVVKYGRAREWWKRNRVWIGMATAFLLAARTAFCVVGKGNSAIASAEILSTSDPFFFKKGDAHGGVGSQERTIWAPPFVAPPELLSPITTITSRDLLGMLSNKLGYAEFVREDGVSAHCNIFPVSGVAWLAPYHVMKQGITRIIVRRSCGLTGSFACPITSSDWVRLGDTDMTLVNLVHGCTNRNFLPYFPEAVGDLSQLSAIMLNKTAECTVDQIRVTDLDGVKQFDEDGVKFSSFSYKTSKPTFVGLCIAPILVITKHPVIAGFHIRGITNGFDGLGHVVTHGMLLSGIHDLSKKSGYSPASLNVLDVQAEFTGSVHHKSPVNWLDSDVERSVTPIGAYVHKDGSPARRAIYNSEVKTTILSPALEARGNPNNWGPPMFKPSWKPFYAFLDGVSRTTHFWPNYREMATRDYLHKIDSAIDADPHFLDQVRVMSDAETLEGVPGVSSLEGMKLDTSLGFPYMKKKNTWFTRVPKADGSGWIVIPPDGFWDKIRAAETKMCGGDRLPFVFTNIPKDEAVKKGKEKVRIMSAGDIFGLTLMRKYCMSLSKLVIDNQFLFECSVGIVTPSKQWDAAAKHLLHFGDGRLIAGDYSAFDQFMPADYIERAFNILIHIAERAGYSDTAISVLKTMASEISHPLYESNGEFFLGHGSNPSGHGLTSIINSIVNSLYLRTCYYRLYAGKPPGSFSDNVNLLTFGDDNIMGVSERASLFNHVTIAAAMRECGVTYTTADKTPVVKEYISLSECTFLKRRFIFREEFGCYVGPIEIGSIYKSLHSTVRSKSISAEQQVADTIDTAMLESVFHGEEFYVSMRSLLRDACEDIGILAFVRDEAWVSYETRVADWHSRYNY